MTPRRPTLLVVDDGCQTLEWLRPGLADVAIVDLRMPQVDGLERYGLVQLRVTSDE